MRPFTTDLFFVRVTGASSGVNGNVSSAIEGETTKGSRLMAKREAALDRLALLVAKASNKANALFVY